MQCSCTLRRFTHAHTWLQVEFELDAGITDEEAKKLLGEDAGSSGKAKCDDLCVCVSVCIVCWSVGSA